MRPVGDPEPIGPDSSDSERATRVLRVAVVALIVFGIEWSMADPGEVAGHPELWPMPWTMLLLMVPVGVGVWAYENVSGDSPGWKVDGLWGVLLGTFSYVALSLLGGPR